MIEVERRTWKDLLAEGERALEEMEAQAAAEAEAKQKKVEAEWAERHRIFLEESLALLPAEVRPFAQESQNPMGGDHYHWLEIVIPNCRVPVYVPMTRVFEGRMEGHDHYRWKFLGQETRFLVPGVKINDEDGVHFYPYAADTEKVPDLGIALARAKQRDAWWAEMERKQAEAAAEEERNLQVHVVESDAAMEDSGLPEAPEPRQSWYDRQVEALTRLEVLLDDEDEENQLLASREIRAIGARALVEIAQAVSWMAANG